MTKLADGRLVPDVIPIGPDGAVYGPDNPMPVEVHGAAEPITITVESGSITADTLGELNDAAVTDPDAASATMPALLRGILENQVSLIALIGADDDEAGDPTVIGLLKQIVANTE
jgi:uncharacterized membrane protein